jgi:hypothetical protein
VASSYINLLNHYFILSAIKNIMIQLVNDSG